MNKEQNRGRSMIEMLGVLGIVGIITVGGLGIVGRARQSSDISRLLTEVSSVAMSSRRLSCQYDSGYGSYTKMLYLSEAYPESMTYSSSGPAFVGSMDAEVKITGSTDAFDITVSNLTEDACMNLATTNWGSKQIQGFLGVCIGTDTCSEGTAVGSQPLAADVASESCADDATVTIKYKGCR